MSRNLLQMTGKIFDEFATRVSEEHKEYIVSVNRHGKTIINDMCKENMQ